MIKIVCVNKNLATSWYSKEKISIGEIYNAEPEYIGLQLGYRIDMINKITGVKLWLPASCFLTLTEWREKQMKSILDE